MMSSKSQSPRCCNHSYGPIAFIHTEFRRRVCSKDNAMYAFWLCLFEHLTVTRQKLMCWVSSRKTMSRGWLFHVRSVRQRSRSLPRHCIGRSGSPYPQPADLSHIHVVLKESYWLPSALVATFGTESTFLRSRFRSSRHSMHSGTA